MVLRVKTIACVITLVNILSVVICCQSVAFAQMAQLGYNVSEFISRCKSKESSMKNCSFDYRDQFGQYGFFKINGKDIHLSEYVFRGNQLQSASYVESFIFDNSFATYEEPPDDGAGEIVSKLSPESDELKIDSLFRYCYVLGLIPTENALRYEYVSDYLEKANLQLEKLIDNKVYFSGENIKRRAEAIFDTTGNLLELSIHNKVDTQKLGAENDLDIVDFHIEFEQLENISDNLFPMKVRVSRRVVMLENKAKGGKDAFVPFIERAPFTFDISITNLELDKNFSKKSFTFSNKIKNGTPASMLDAPQIRYIWMDGKVVPKTDELMLEIARGGHKFMPGPKEPRFWFMSIGIILIFIACGAKAYKHFNKAGADI